MVLIFFISIYVIFLSLLIKPQAVYLVEVYLMTLAGKDIFVVFFFDSMSYLFVNCILVISLVVFFYSNYYMDTDTNRLGFMLLLTSFVICMICLLLSPNLITLLLGWDGLGLTSYLLVIYYSSYSSSAAGMLTFLLNRLGDAFFLFSIGLMSLLFDWEKLTGSFVVVSVLLILALTTKSAQTPFSAWLPAAMAAPTPVSSLVHSSTLVTAGLYLMIRYYYLLNSCMKILLWMGVMTLLAAGLMAFFEWDLKKLIAFSTLSQLGFMVSAYAMGLVWVSFFHLLTHAFFKASLFLSAGALIHNADNSQEFRNMFLVPFQLFWISGVVNICLLCLCGIPFTSGFYSKDLIVDGGSFSIFLFLTYMAGVMFTLVYSTRFLLYSHRFFIFHSCFKLIYDKVLFLMVPVFLLAFMAVFMGWFFFEFLFSFKFFVMVASGWKLLYLLMFVAMILSTFKLNTMLKSNYKNNFFFSSIFFLKNLSTLKVWKIFFSLLTRSFLKSDQGVLESGGPQGIFLVNFLYGKMLFNQHKFFFVSYFFGFMIFLFFM